MTYPDAVNWRKPRRSMNNGNCLEAGNVPGRVVVRDTQDRDGVMLAYPAKAWRAFTADLTGGKVPPATA